MSTPVNTLPDDPVMSALRQKILLYLQWVDFEIALTEARQLNAHPPEDLWDGRGKLPPEKLPLVRRQVEQSAEETWKELQKHHCENVMMPLLRKDVPYSVAEEVVKVLIIGPAT